MSEPAATDPGVSEPPEPGRVTGIGGLYFRCRDPDGLRGWYREHLGLPTAADGGIWFEWRELEGERLGRTVFQPCPETCERFDAGTRPFMLRYRVDDLDALLARLCEAGETVFDAEPPNDEGRFARLVDPDGQTVELFEPAGSPGDGTPAGGDVTPGGDVAGIGGIFFTSPEPAVRKAWYADRLGILPGEDGYVSFTSRTPEGDLAHLAWEIFPADTDYFEPSRQPFMVNFRVADLARLRARLLEAPDVWVDPKLDEYEYGSFGWVLDPAGIRIELWEPIDSAFEA